MNAPVLMMPTGLGLDVPVGWVVIGMCVAAALLSAVLLRFAGSLDEDDE